MAEDPDDLLGRLLDLHVDGRGPDPVGIRNVLLGLTIGWLPTATRALVLALDELLDRPDALAGATRAARDHDDDLLRAHLWEALRLRPHNSGLLRVARTDTVLAGDTDRAETVSAGALVYAVTQSAMADADVVEAPEEFRTDRPDAIYLHFGFGPHRCLGEQLMRTQLPVLAGALLRHGHLTRRGPIRWDGLLPTQMTVRLTPHPESTDAHGR